MEINVLIEEGLEVDIDAEWMQRIVEKPLTEEEVPPNIEISLVITGQERIQELNREYRGIDKPTDVLSFSMAEQKEVEGEPEEDEDEEPISFIGPPDGVLHLGEVIISYPQAVIQAKERNHPVKKEMAVLIIHGVLHILGYDHEKPEMAPIMEAREKEILEGLKKELE